MVLRGSLTCQSPERLPHALPETTAIMTHQLPFILVSSYEVDGLLQDLLCHSISCGDRVGCTSRTRWESSLHQKRLYPGFRALLAAEDDLLWTEMQHDS